MTLEAFLHAVGIFFPEICCDAMPCAGRAASDSAICTPDIRSSVGSISNDSFLTSVFDSGEKSHQTSWGACM